MPNRISHFCQSNLDNAMVLRTFHTSTLHLHQPHPRKRFYSSSSSSLIYREMPRCKELRKSNDPSMGDLLLTLGCDRDCQGILVSSRLDHDMIGMVINL